MAGRAILAIDEGTTNSKAVLVSEAGRIIASGAAPVPIEHPQSGWVQQDANAIWQATQKAISDCIAQAPGVEVTALGIANQRESVLIWDRDTGAPLGPVITWQCRRTADACAALKSAGHEPLVIARTGLPLDPLFPPTKAAWLLNQSDTLPQRIAIGTVDSWLIWKLSGGKVHATDRSNAARTQLYNIAEGAWDTTLCDLFGVNPDMLPEVQDSAHIFGVTQGTDVVPDGTPIAAAIGDSHAALFGHGAFNPGDGKVTFGTGSSVMTTIPAFTLPPKGITTTIAWSLDGTPTYAFEGNILVSASILPWTANLLGLDSVDALLALAQSVPDAAGATLVPAHVGLGAPHWAAQARGLIGGLSFGTGPAHIARAAADSIALQVLDVYAIMAEAAGALGRLYVDGGPSGNSVLMQGVADVLDRPVIPGKDTDLSALGAAYLAGRATGLWPDMATIASFPAHGPDVTPHMPASQRTTTIDAWRNAVARTCLDV